MNPRQRRGALFLVLATAIGFGVFLAVASYVASVESQVGARTTVYEAAGPIEPYIPLGEQNLRAVEVPERWTSATARMDLAELRGRRVGFRIEPGTVVTSDMLLPPSSLDPDQREIAINVDPVTGIGGRVRPGDSVDIYAVFADMPRTRDQVRVLVRNVRVVSIGGQQTIQENDDQKGISESKVVPVTLALDPEAAKAVTFANAFAEEVRLVGLPTDVGTNRTDESDTYDARNLVAPRSTKAPVVKKPVAKAKPAPKKSKG
jgi:pilus assembly protein CpaB